MLLIWLSHFCTLSICVCVLAPVDELQGMNGDFFLNDLQNVTALVPFMGCAGNHEQAFNFSHLANKFNNWNYVHDPKGKPDQNWWYSVRALQFPRTPSFKCHRPF